MFDKLSKCAEIWIDDTVRNSEKVICEEWASRYHFDLEFVNLEKGLGWLRRL